jgi:hypothetical protein
MTDEEYEQEENRFKEDPGYGIVGVEDLEAQILRQTFSIMDSYIESWEQWRSLSQH